MIDKERVIINTLEKRSMIEESIFQQKSGDTWLRLGDANTKYFIAVMKERALRNNIFELTALNGTVLKDKVQIQKELISFYKSLMGTACTSLPVVNRQVMRLGPILSYSQQIQLCRKVTD